MNRFPVEESNSFVVPIIGEMVEPVDEFIDLKDDLLNLDEKFSNFLWESG